MTQAEPARPRLWWILRLAIIGVVFTAGTALILLFPILPVQSPFDLSVGEIATEDIRAPRQVTYISQIETQAARAAARASVQDVYDPADPRTSRQQVRRARQVMEFVIDIRADSQADTDLKHRYLDAITTLSIPSETRYALLAIPESQFSEVEAEIVTLIEESMSGPVREGRESEVTSRLELRVSTDLPEDLIPLVVAMARDLIVANSYLNEQATDQARAEAEAAVPEIQHTFEPNQVVIRAGERIDELDLEAMQALGLTAQKLTWRDVGSAVLVSLLSALILGVYLAGFNPIWPAHTRYLLVLAVLFLLFLAAGQIMIPDRAVTAYLFPAAALALALTALLGLEFAALATIILAMLVGFIANHSLEVAVFTAMTGLVAAGSLQRGTRLNNYFLAGIFAAFAGIVVLLAFRLPTGTDSVRLAQLLSVSVLNGLFSAGLSLVILFVVGSITGIPTSIHLIDLTRPDHPLQRRMQREALGSYQHTLSVVNLVEAGADAIGANTLIARVGTLYHDVGKAANPGFFVENRTEGNPNPHEGLSALASARIIRAHVSDGVRLAKKHRLPAQIIDFIPQHHGTTSIAYFLNMAREEAEAAGTTIDDQEFFYGGPIPQSREAAILMLADGCESAVRANRPATTEEIESVVSRIIQQRIDQHQLDDSGLTLTDIRKVKDAFVRTLKGMYHPRVKYPGDEKPSLPPTSDSAAALLPGEPGESNAPQELRSSTNAQEAEHPLK